MPELPEVEHVVRALRSRIVARQIIAAEVRLPKLIAPHSPALFNRKLKGSIITGVSRRGKFILIEMENDRVLAVHLRMTGRLIWARDGGRESRAHLRAEFRLDRGKLSFFDTRRFGTLEWYRDRSEAEPAGIDPLSASLSESVLARLVRGSRQNIKAWLLRQDRLVGLGNIYASEILHLAGISPLREAGSLDERERRRLLGATRRVLSRAIGNSGTTFSDFQDARGLEGSYQHYLRVYAREGRPCRRCAEPVVREVQQQRSTFYCPRCQS